MKRPAAGSRPDASLLQAYSKPSAAFALTKMAGLHERFFSPDSEIWRVDREMALLLAGGRALLMQIAHPKVAAGVAEHSGFQSDPLGRLERTMSAMWSIVFDEQAQARAALERVAGVHRKVRGVVPRAEAQYSGAGYEALDPSLLLWVHGTLIDSALAAYELFVRPLSMTERAHYYEDSKKLAALFGIEAPAVPASLTDFAAYMEEMLHGDTLTVGPAAKRLAQEILYPRPWFLRLAGPLFRFITAGLLPEKLRESYQLEWNARKNARFLRLAGLIRALIPWLPARARVVPRARIAERRRR